MIADFNDVGFRFPSDSVVRIRRTFMAVFKCPISTLPAVVYAFRAQANVAIYASLAMLFVLVYSLGAASAAAKSGYGQVCPKVHHASVSEGRSVARQTLPL
jgi:hypothetical protein